MTTQKLGSNRDDFDDEKIPSFYQALQLPTSERRKLGLIGDTPYRYQGVDMSKLGQIAKTAMGTPKEVPFGDALEADGGYKLEQKTLVRGNNPLQYADLLYKGLQSNKYGQGARSLYNQMPEERKQQIRKQFLDIPDADFESKWGVKKENLLSMFNNDDKAGQYVMLDAMKYAVDNMPQFGQSKFRPNEAFKTEQNKDEWNRRNAITSRQAASRAATVAAGKDAQPIVDVWGGIVDAVGNSKTGAIAFNELEPDAQEILLGFAKKAGKDVDQSEVVVFKNPQGGYELREVERATRNGKQVDVVGKLITSINRQVVNLQGQPSVQEKRKVIGGGKSSQKSAKKYKGLDKNGNPIFE